MPQFDLIFNYYLTFFFLIIYFVYIFGFELLFNSAIKFINFKMLENEHLNCSFFLSDFYFKYFEVSKEWNLKII